MRAMDRVLTCSVPDCERKHCGKGWCKLHYERMRNNGSLEPKIIKFNNEKRFWSYVEKTDTCWIFTTRQSIGGYTQININGKWIGAHRYSYELHKGKIPQGHHIDHLCKVTNCVNPDHLEAVTLRENVHRGNLVTKKKSGLPVGVSRHGNGYQSEININGTKHYLGTFKTIKEASEAYRRVEV